MKYLQNESLSKFVWSIGHIRVQLTKILLFKSEMISLLTSEIYSATLVIVVIYSFYGTNDDKPHYFTQAKYKETVIENSTLADFETSAS